MEIHLEKEGKSYVKCVVCDERFYKTLNSKQKYCSIECRSQDKEYRKKIVESTKKRVLIFCKQFAFLILNCSIFIF